nr:response regulator [uncultured Caproiciproducens sp.]
MYKVIIIDDEDIIVEDLKKVVNWAKYDCEVVATASEAESGAQAIRENNPDILFTDIKMPNMDGPTILTGLKSEFPNMQITVLTDYRNVEYATQAIHIGVTRFLLKPSKMDELEESLQTMTENLRRQHKGIPESKEKPAEELQETNTANNFIVRGALDYIELHYADKLTLTELAEKAYVSQWYLSKLLNKYTNRSFWDLLNQTRIKKAEELLQNPSLKIYEISDLLGFNDVNHFSRVFKKIKQMSPNEYRKVINK